MFPLPSSTLQQKRSPLRRRRRRRLVLLLLHLSLASLLQALTLPFAPPPSALAPSPSNELDPRRCSRRHRCPPSPSLSLALVVVFLFLFHSMHISSRAMVLFTHTHTHSRDCLVSVAMATQTTRAYFNLVFIYEYYRYINKTTITSAKERLLSIYYT